ncbi:hypothetical protein NHX12_032613 [Muraenolepis orangiensis]|uniref:Reverse transcriptase RNase H-like domain-containing protein n=1 Tax=Muraenolepis orangiensis TaxID=630683 RepID=A0A9Q0IKS9_9TELE|nr:hypothetical protein NHX12_017184 [Muraenolepis orangiensis]KAJ3601638.1 hypothetical protein NHX12_032606 [Muraenolepis orangiensis]KAJ3601645.1 hypothetical protein NHX12_032613 [Muraenolepis orangiensis]
MPSHFRQYLLGRPFTVRTDHSSLRWLTQMKKPEGQLARWLERLGEYNFEIVHRPGRLHSNADSLVHAMPSPVVVERPSASTAVSPVGVERSSASTAVSPVGVSKASPAEIDNVNSQSTGLRPTTQLGCSVAGAQRSYDRLRRLIRT